MSQLGFFGKITTEHAGPVRLRLGGSHAYRVFVDGRFVHYGPARCGHGWYRWDELESELAAGNHTIAIEAVHYDVPNFVWASGEAFLQAEVWSGHDLLLATQATDASFHAKWISERLLHVDRIGIQRPHAEIYQCTGATDLWRTGGIAAEDRAPLKTLPPRRWVDRGVPIPFFRVIPVTKQVDSGTFTRDATFAPTIPWYRQEPLHSWLKNYQDDEIVVDILPYIEGIEFHPILKSSPKDFHPLDLTDQTYTTLKLDANRTGFIGVEVEVQAATRLIILYDEHLVGPTLHLRPRGQNRVIVWDLQPGNHRLETIEVYTFQYMKVLNEGGRLRLKNVTLREYANDAVWEVSYTHPDPELQLVFEAGRQTFRQNAPDLYMDCPGRERAGWLCDSFFTARAESALCGHSRVERNFLENFLLPERFPYIEVGMLPMCYPSDHANGRFIPQWALWFVLELEEYLHRTGDSRLIERARPRVEALMAWFAKKEMPGGLLRELPSWNFIEWSEANKLTKGINFPTNMLYSGTLESAYRLYAEPTWRDRAQRVRAAVMEHAWDGTWFHDLAVIFPDGTFQVTPERTEACQYYAAFFGFAGPHSHPDFWQALVHRLGTSPTEEPVEGLFPANVFIGYYLRMDLLLRHGEHDTLKRELKGLYLEMAQMTGTLWEKKDEHGSLNHGFASYVCAVLKRLEAADA